jgi:hypothetical protein
MALKSQVDDKFKQIDKVKIQEKKDPKSADLESPQKKNAEVATAEGAGPPVEAKPVNPIKPLVTPPIPFGQSGGIGFRTVTTNTKESVGSGASINLDAKPRYLLMNYQFTRPWALNSPWVAFARVNFGRIMNTLDVELDPYMALGLFQSFLFQNGFMPYLGVDRQNLTFVGLPVTGEGLRPGSVDLTMTVAGAYIKMELFKQSLVVVPEFGLGILGSSGYRRLSDAKIKSNRVSLALQFMNVVKKINLELNYYQLNFESSGEEPMTADSSGMGLNVFYHF